MMTSKLGVPTIAKFLDLVPLETVREIDVYQYLAYHFVIFVKDD
jgi:hypothetical protein